MKKIFTLLFISTMLFSCSQDSEIIDENELEALSFEEKLAKGDFDDSNLGIYKGLFTTLDGQERATIHVTLNGISEPTVEFSFPDFTKAVIRSKQDISKGQAVEGMKFNEGDFDFTFKVDQDGSNPVMENVTYKGQKGDVVVVKETSKAPVQTKTGTYTCETGCFDDADDNVPHPELGAPGALQTFSFMLTGAAGDSPITMQYVLNSRVYTGPASQNGCDTGVFGNLVTCEIFAEPGLNGNSGPIRFRSLDNPTTSLLFHEYAAETTSISCSSYYGTGIYRSTIFGKSTVSIITDDTVGDGGDCNDRG